MDRPPLPSRFILRPGLSGPDLERANRLGPLLLEGDDLADAAAEALSALPSDQREQVLGRALETPDGQKDAPEPLRAFSRALHEVPFWVDFDRVERGGRALLRTGMAGGFALAFRSLMVGYLSPAGNKPLVFSGRLKESAPRRLAETGRFVEAVAKPGGMRPGASGFVFTGRVRIMHAQVRRLLVASPRWETQKWGVPINQVDMAGTALLFSLQVTDGVRKLGVPFTDEDAEDLQYLWRYAARVMGVKDELLFASVAEARAYWAALEATQGPADDDSAALAQALTELQLTQAKTKAERERAVRSVGVAQGITRFLIGDEAADALRLPRTPWRYAGLAVSTLLARTAFLRKVPLADRLMEEAGLAYWRRTVAQGLGKEDARFEMPERVRHA